MAMAIILMHKSYFVVGVSAFAVAVNAMELNLNAATELIYSDNVDLSAQKNDGFFTTYSAGMTVFRESAHSTLSFDYDAYHIQHFNHQRNDETKNQLAFDYRQDLYQDQLNFAVNGGINNVSRRFNNILGDNLLQGQTVQTRTLNSSLSYQNDWNEYFDLYTTLNAALSSNQDNIGNFYQLGGDVKVKNAENGNRATWSTDYQYNKTFYIQGNNAENYRLSQTLGYDVFSRLNASVAFNYQVIKQDNSSFDETFFSWGPEFRYQLNHDSFLQLGYQFADDGDDFLTGSLLLNPTSRTSLGLNFTRKLYGNSYDFFLTHKLRKITNSLTYNEQLASFDRNFFVEGESVDSLQLAKGWRYDGNLRLNRASLSWYADWSEREPVSFQQLKLTQVFNSGINISHSLSSKTKLTSSYQFERNSIDYRQSASENVYFRQLQFGLSHQLSKKFSTTLGYQYVNSTHYSENKANIQLAIRL